MNTATKVALQALSVALAAASLHLSMTASSAWKPTGKTAIFLPVSRVKELRDAKNTHLLEQLRLFGAEFGEKVPGGRTLPVTVGERRYAGKHDMIVGLDPDAGIPAQGYTLRIRGGRLVLTAGDADGLFYGCREIIRQLMLKGNVTDMTDAPDVNERVLMLDIGRKYYTPDWIKRMIREMSWARMNTLVLHFSEEMGLGLESKRYPWLNGRDGQLSVPGETDTDNRYITQEELADIAAYAARYHVELVPSFDSPGHMNYIVKMFNERAAREPFTFESGGETVFVPQGTNIANYYHYNGKVSIVQGSRNTAFSRGIDISNEIAVAFTRSLLMEYGALFASLGCTKFDIGGDELLGWGASIDAAVPRWQQLDHWKQYARKRAEAEGRDASFASGLVAYDGFMYYMNDVNRLVRQMGCTSVRMWNDDAYRATDTGWSADAGAHIQLDPDIEIEYWSETSGGANKPAVYLEDGRTIHNYINIYSYYVLGITTPYAHCNAGDIYTAWNARVFQSVRVPDTTGPGRIGGSAFCIWADAPLSETEAHVMATTLPMIRANGAKAWDAAADSKVSFQAFEAHEAILGDAPTGSAELPEVSFVP